MKHTLLQGEELLLEVSKDQAIQLTLWYGRADIFGADIIPRKEYHISGQKIAVFARENSGIHVKGEPSIVYKSQNTLMPAYLKIHEVLEERRSWAKISGSKYPRVLVVGPPDSGKTTVIRILSNLASKQNWHPTVVDLDVGLGLINMPGCISATVWQSHVNVDYSFFHDPVIAYYYGYLTPQEAPEHYKILVETIAAVIDRKSCSTDRLASSGLFIDTIGFRDGLGYDLLCHQAEFFACDVVIVIGQRKLYYRFLQHARHVSSSSGRQINVLKLPRSSEAVIRTSEIRRLNRNLRIANYFYNAEVTHNNLPIYHVPFGSIEVYRIGGNKASTSTLAFGSIVLYNPLKVTTLTIDSELEHSILAVSHAVTPHEILLSNVAGFIQILRLDFTKKIVFYVSPNSGNLAGRILLAGFYKSPALA